MTRFALRAAFAAAILSCSWASSVLAGDAVKDAPITLPEQTIVKLSDEALGPFVWGWEGSLKISDELFTKAAAKRDPLVLFRLAFRLMREESQTGSKEAGALALKILDYMIDEYQPADRGDAGIHWKYGFDYEGIKAGWWSGMDAFFGPMTLYAAWQQYGVERYKDVALKSVKLGLRSPPKWWGVVEVSRGMLGVGIYVVRHEALRRVPGVEWASVRPSGFVYHGGLDEGQRPHRSL